MERSWADPFFALGPRLIDALLDTDEPERHHDDKDEKPLRQKIETEREMQEAEAIEPGESGDGGDDGEEHDEQNGDGEDQRLNLVADARGVLAHGTFDRHFNPLAQGRQRRYQPAPGRQTSAAPLAFNRGRVVTMRIDSKRERRVNA